MAINLKFINKLDKNIKGAFEVSFKKLYIEKTKLFYDFVVDENGITTVPGTSSSPCLIIFTCF